MAIAICLLITTALEIKSHIVFAIFELEHQLDFLQFQLPRTSNRGQYIGQLIGLFQFGGPASFCRQIKPGPLVLNNSFDPCVLFSHATSMRNYRKLSPSTTVLTPFAEETFPLTPTKTIE